MLSACPVYADVHADGTASPDSHAPIGVMGDHLHNKGEVMLSFRTMHMDMDGNRKGTSNQSTSEVLADYMVAPLDMTMDMQMVGVMFAPSDDLTLMVMGSYVELEMEHVTRMGMRFKTRASGFGDTSLMGLYRLWDRGAHHLHLNAGFSAPTGSIDNEDNTPMSGGANVQLPYPMQLGSGTWDLLPGITWTFKSSDEWSAGAQASAVLRVGENDHDYTLGDRYSATSWLARRVSPAVSLSARVSASTWGDIDGADDELPPMMGNVVPTADPDRRAGTEGMLHIGLNFIGQSGPLHNHRLSFEAGAPIYQHLDGPQLRNRWQVTGGWQYAF